MVEKIQREIEPINYKSLEDGYKKAFFDLNQESIFEQFKNQQLQARPGEDVVDSEIFLRDSIRNFFVHLSRTTNKSPSEIEVPRKAFDTSPDYVSFSGAMIDLEPINVFPRNQIWFAEWNLHDMTDDNPKLVDRRDKVIESKILKSLDYFFTLREKNTSQAAEKKATILSQVQNQLQTPIEGYLIQYQTIEKRNTFVPLVGVRLCRYIMGWQGYPVNYAGKQAITFYDNPLFEGKKVHIDALSAEIDVNLVSDKEFKDSDWHRVTEKLVERSGFEE